MNLLLATLIARSNAAPATPWRSLAKASALALSTALACLSTADAAVLAGWNVSGMPGGLSNYGPSPLAATTTAVNLTVGGLTRGAGVVTNSGSGATRGWGGNSWNVSTAAAAATAGKFVTFTLTANAGYKVSISGISRFDYRRSSTGATSGVLQYQVGNGTFVDAATLSYPSSASAGAMLPAIDLSGISALQDVPSGTTITFRVVNYGASAPAGTWYVFDQAVSTASDLEISGTVATAGPAVDGSCGSANGLTFPQAPATNLCSDGSTPSVTDGGNAWNWSCPGSNGGQAATCTAVNSSASGC